ncbi:histidine--tRNA ligase [Sphingomonas sp. CGMCC 1.13654]|uniref:Histidine--tRNA ligase n=1 Tax=Sphingomonas chungangi TaxID=2683589 RepID=A0A838L7W0_9SPHN|nr:histidine--tRNA ligase [Sphingomonas chungangi]MBA2935264.1 histidine--tRNA ligase [Sphingomonas chungangi]MVW56771.1 histidine--tRNA ligase [Sphingomonas chungangi]
MARPETPKPIRGTQDLFGDSARRHHAVVEAFERVRKLYGFQQVQVPIFEATAVFARSIGETTDVVSKEMYTFEDRGGDSLTLRPEFTAGLCRAYLTEGWQQFAPLKLATHGPVFRYERPQKGRYRQFHQIDAEVIGAAEPSADVELLVLADQLLKELKVDDGVTLQLNTLGDSETRDAWRQALVAHFEGHRGDLSEDSQTRLDKNPLRILDSKDPRDRSIADAAPGIDDHMSSEAGAFFEAVTRGLDAAGVAWTRNARLVRGLDYYRHTAFEFVTDRLGAQGTVLGGGRYDGLIETLGGPHTPAVGWAAGIERLGMLIHPPIAERPEIVVAVEDDQLQQIGTKLVSGLRRKGVATEVIASGSVKKRFDRAMKLDPRLVLSLNTHALGTHDIARAKLKTLGVVIGQGRDAAGPALDDLLLEYFDVVGTWSEGGEVILRMKGAPTA